jgi:hypothetical protein
VRQARALGATERQIRSLRDSGWRSAIRGVLIDPHARDPFRASVRAALLACPRGVAGGVTAARLHQLRGLPQWTASEPPLLLLPRGSTYDSRSGLTIRVTDLTGQVGRAAGLPTVCVDRAVRDLVARLDLADAVTLCDAALQRGWQPDPRSWPRAQARALRRLLPLADGRSESALETRIRLILVAAGVAPQELQYEIRDGDGHLIARLDMAWPDAKLALEADGKAHHDPLPAVYRDRRRSNDLGGLGWRVLRFTWADLRYPGWIVQQVRRALAAEPTS